MKRKPPILSIVTASLILFAVLLPGSNVPKSPAIPFFDKIVHFIMFFCLAIALHLDFDILGRKKLAIALAFGMSFSVITELLQIWVDGRTSEIVDIAADISGFGLGVFLRGFLGKKRT